MPKFEVYHHALNVGVVDKDKLPRVDLERMRLASEIQTNLLCDTVGKAFLRPGFEYLGAARDSGEALLKRFVFGASDAALIELSDLGLRVWVDDQLVTRSDVQSSVSNGDFSDPSGWSLATGSGQTSTVSGGSLSLSVSAKGGLAVATQEVLTSSPNVPHALRIIVTQGPVTFRCGATNGGEEYISETDLRTGEHSLEFTPTGSFWVRFENANRRTVTVDSVQVESAGVMVLPSPWPLPDLSKVRNDQSADVIFAGADGYKQRRIERRSDSSWSMVEYSPEDGPFTAFKTSSARLNPSVLEGSGTLTADASIFTPEHVGALFRLDHTGQKISQSLVGDNHFTDAFEVTGIKNGTDWDDRDWSYEVSGTWSGTLRVYRSYDGEFDGYSQFRRDSGAATIDITANGSFVNTDDDNNASIWYRIGFEDSAYTSGAPQIDIEYDGGGGYGICRVTQFNTPLSVDIEVLKPFKDTTYTEDWLEGEWSDHRGWPSATAFFDGRLWWAGSDRFWGSVSDAFESFDHEVIGDSGPIARAIATGGVNQAQWILPLQRLVIGTDGAETSARSSSFDEPLTPTNITLKDASTIGSSAVDPARIDSRGLFVDAAGTNIFELLFAAENSDYSSTEFSKLSKNLFTSGIKQIAVQRRPDTRVWVVMNDGSLVCVVYEPTQEVFAFIPVETAGSIESVAVLPAPAQDRLYISVRRTIEGQEVRYIEKMALDSETVPGVGSKTSDSYVSTTAVGLVVSGLMHLNGREVVVRANGEVIYEDGTEKLFTVVAGEITLPSGYEDAVCVVGLQYIGRYKSARLSYGVQGGTGMLRRKKVAELGIVATDYDRDAIKYGSAFDDSTRPLYPLPSLAGGVAAPSQVVGEVDDETPFVFPGEWSTDSRVCIEVRSPGCASILGLVVGMETN